MPLHSPLLRYFDAVRRTGSIRAAARDLAISSSAVNRRILALEAELGVALFERLPGRVRLTAAGEVLAGHVRATLQDAERALSEIEALQGLQSGGVSVAGIEGLSVAFMPAVVATLRRRHPRIDVSFEVGGSARVVERVVAGDSDLGITFDAPRRRELRGIAQRAYPFGVVMRPDHPMAAAERLAFADLADEPLILPDPETDAGARVRAGLARLDPPARAAVRTTSFAFAKSVAERGLGLAFQTRLGLEPELASGALVHVPLVEGEPLQQVLTVVVRAERTLPVAAATLAEIVTDHLLSDAAPAP